MAGAELSALQREVLGAAAGRARSELSAELGGAWGDALPLLAAGEWRAGRTALLTPAPQSTATAVQAWMQARRCAELSAFASRGCRCCVTLEAK